MQQIADWLQKLGMSEYTQGFIGNKFISPYSDGSDRSMHKQLKPCPDCGAPIGQRHNDGCDVERCPHCGWAALGCAHFHPDDPRRGMWTGKWPGVDDCERLGLYVTIRTCPILIACSPTACGTPTRSAGSGSSSLANRFKGLSQAIDTFVFPKIRV
jgi:hypothetical protein